MFILLQIAAILPYLHMLLANFQTSANTDLREVPAVNHKHAASQKSWKNSYVVQAAS